VNNPARGLPRTVKLFGAVSLLNDFASDMIYPLLPAFITTVLGAGAAALGALDGAAEFAAALVKYVAGRLADRQSRRGRLVVAGYGVAIVVRPLIALTAAAWQVIGLRVVDRLGKGLRTPPRDALIADATPPALRGRAFGLQRGMDHAGAVLGPITAWYLLAQRHVPLRGIIAASIVPGVVVMALAVWATWDWERTRAAASERPSASTAAATSPPPAEPWRRGLFFAISFFYLLRLPETLLILRSQQLGVSITVVPLLWAAVHVVKSSVSFATGAWSDHAGPERPMWTGWVCYAVLATAMAFATSALQAWLLFIALGSVWGLTESPERAVVARAARDQQGSGFGIYHGTTGLAALVGGVSLGAVYQTGGARLAFLLSAGAGSALAIGWFVVRGRGGGDG
jgi:MFS family permease